MTPYGLIHQQSLDPAFTTPPPNLTYCPVRQQTLANGVPLAAQPTCCRRTRSRGAPPTRTTRPTRAADP